MSKLIATYKRLDIRLYDKLPMLLAFLAFWVANPVSASAHTDYQISLTESEKDYASLSQDDSIINAASVHNYLELLSHNLPDSIPTDSVEENEEEDDEEDDNFAALKRQLLLKDMGYNQLYNQQVYRSYQRKKLPLYLLFHSWKSHLI